MSERIESDSMQPCLHCEQVLPGEPDWTATLAYADEHAGEFAAGGEEAL